MQVGDCALELPHVDAVVGEPPSVEDVVDACEKPGTLT
jgi:hypothetical protein